MTLPAQHPIDHAYSEEFISASEHFKMLAVRLGSNELSTWEHNDVENLIYEEGMELLRQMYQGYFDRMASREPRLAVVEGADAVVRTHCRQACTRQLMSQFGEVVVTRKGYSARGATSCFPLDAQLNLPPDKFSLGLRKRVVAEAISNSFENTVEAVIETTGGRIAKRQAEELVAEVSQDFEAFYDQGRTVKPAQTEDPLILTSDAKGIVMKEKDLREATRKAAEKKKAERRKKRLSSGEKKNRKRMAMVGSVYTVAPHKRRAEQVMGLEERTEKKPKIDHKRVWASVERDAEVVIEEIFQEALRQDPDKKRPWVFLIDGHEDQLRLIRARARHHNVTLTIVVDFIHVLEYLWKAAYAFFSPGSEEAEHWVNERALWLLQGKVSDVAAGMRRKATRLQLSAQGREPVDKCADYLLKYKDQLHYDHALAQGYPIATGVIEGACRHLINDRMNITGARWRLQCAEAILKLRSLRSSGDLDAYWIFYKAQSKQRHHAARYAGDTLPLAA